jgi:hypothetical protein
MKEPRSGDDSQSSDSSSLVGSRTLRKGLTAEELFGFAAGSFER